MFDLRKHNYCKKLKLFEEGKMPRCGLSEVDVCHDDWCRMYGGGYCSCDPEIKLRPPAHHRPPVMKVARKCYVALYA